MDLQEANYITKSFTLDGNQYTPAVSDDWTYSFSSFYNSDDRVNLSSEKLGVNIAIKMNINLFFQRFIFTGKIKIDKNKLIGSFSYSKYGIHMEEEFLEAVEVVAEQTRDIIPNNELIEYGVYLDDKGETFIYLGHFEYMTLGYKTKNIVSKKRFIAQYSGKDYPYMRTPIAKTGKRKFIKHIRTLRMNEMDDFYSLFFREAMHNPCFIRKNFNKVVEIKNESTYSSSFIKSNDKYYFHVKEMDYNTYTRINKFMLFDFEKFVSDAKSYTIDKIEDYFIQEEEPEEYERINLFFDYE